ncbi:molecular chaperone DnaK [Algoriphagus sp. H41]|uniref:Molecular chaperone DnaK n=1 Tax=Algoriphagus oliviformis TaxID=2811231 RepID=A0ABS3C362_9BACT|nr:molecular chaperone DnaK [Algoriphagus oliviformis]MBN7810039.1 molecular chaperone DnaK [Algoriphagus oliviformis]
MKIEKKDFEKMRAKYAREIGSGKPATNKKGKIKKQTDWIFFDRKSLEAILAETDPEKGGIRFYFTEYTSRTAKKYHPKQGELYNGLMTLVYEAASCEALAEEPGEDFENVGHSCPPTCQTPEKKRK